MQESSLRERRGGSVRVPDNDQRKRQKLGGEKRIRVANREDGVCRADCVRSVTPVSKKAWQSKQRTLISGVSQLLPHAADVCELEVGAVRLLDVSMSAPKARGSHRFR